MSVGIGHTQHNAGALRNLRSVALPLRRGLNDRRRLSLRLRRIRVLRIRRRNRLRRGLRNGNFHRRNDVGLRRLRSLRRLGVFSGRFRCRFLREADAKQYADSRKREEQRHGDALGQEQA